MAIYTKKAKKVLTKAEQKHLTESGINTMKKMQRQINFMKELRASHPKSSMPCWDCWFIGRKLGLIGENEEIGSHRGTMRDSTIDTQNVKRDEAGA